MTHTNQPGISYIFKHPASFPFLIHSDTAAQSASSSPLAAPEIELQSVIILTSPHAHIASPHTLLNKTSRKAESAFLLTNTHRMMPSLFKSVKTFLWLWRLVPVPGPFCRDGWDTLCWLLKPLRFLPSRSALHPSISLVHTSHLWQVLGLPCTCHRGCMNRQSYKLWIYFWKESGLGHGFSSKATHTVRSSSSNLQSLPHSHREHESQNLERSKAQERRQWWPPLEIQQWERARVTIQIMNPALNLLPLCSLMRNLSSGSRCSWTALQAANPLTSCKGCTSATFELQI